MPTRLNSPGPIYGVGLSPLPKVAGNVVPMSLSKHVDRRRGPTARCRWRSHRCLDTGCLIGPEGRKPFAGGAATGLPLLVADSPGGTTAWCACSVQPVLSTTRGICGMDARRLSALRACLLFVVPTGGFATGKGLPPLRGLERRPGPEGRKLGAGGAATGVLILVADRPRGPTTRCRWRSHRYPATLCR